QELESKDEGEGEGGKKEMKGSITWSVADATKLSEHELVRKDGYYRTVIDTALFHVFIDTDRAQYVKSLNSVLPRRSERASSSSSSSSASSSSSSASSESEASDTILYLLCFSDLQGGDRGPRRIKQEEIREAFNQEAGWN